MTDNNGHQPDTVATDGEQWQFYDKARIAVQSGDHSLAASLCDQALEVDATFSAALELAGVLACQQREFDKGISYFKRLVDAEPESAEAWFNLGNAFNGASQEELSIEPLQKSLALKPEFHKSAVVLSQSLYATGEHQEAVELLEHTIHHDPDNVMALNTLSTLLARLENYEAAIPHIKQAVKLQPKFSELHANLGMIQFRAGQVNEAKDSFLSALTLNHRDLESRFGLGAIARLKHSYEEACGHFRKLLKHSPQNKSAMLNLIDCLKASKNQSEAAKWLKTAQQSWPDDERFKA